MTDQWDNFLNHIEIPEEFNPVLKSAASDPIILEGFVSFVIDQAYEAFAMHYETDAQSFVPLLPEEERRNMVDASDDLESALRDAIRNRLTEVAGSHGN